MSNTENLVKVARELSQSEGSLSFELPTATLAMDGHGGIREYAGGC